MCQVEAPAAEPTGPRQRAQLGAIVAFDSRGAATTACTDGSVSVLVDHVKKERQDAPGDVHDSGRRPDGAANEAGGGAPVQRRAHVEGERERAA
jgi:hypothetical protein